MTKTEYNALILLSDENKATAIVRRDSVLLMAELRTNQYQAFHNFEAYNVLRRTQYKKKHFSFRREHANEMTFRDQNYTKTYSRIRIVPNIPFPDK
jgi:hypothetical protein